MIHSAELCYQSLPTGAGFRNHPQGVCLWFDVSGLDLGLVKRPGFVHTRSWQRVSWRFRTTRRNITYQYIIYIHMQSHMHMCIYIHIVLYIIHTCTYLCMHTYHAIPYHAMPCHTSYITLHCITLHYIASYHITSHHIRSHHITSHTGIYFHTFPNSLHFTPGLALVPLGPNNWSLPPMGLAVAVAEAATPILVLLSEDGGWDSGT
jgi:hypothetical protein